MPRTYMVEIEDKIIEKARKIANNMFNVRVDEKEQDKLVSEVANDIRCTMFDWVYDGDVSASLYESLEGLGYVVRKKDPEYILVPEKYRRR